MSKGFEQLSWIPVIRSLAHSSLAASGVQFNVDDNHPADFSPFVCEPFPVGDLNGDCIINMLDFVLFANSFPECNLMPQDLCDL